MMALYVEGSATTMNDTNSVFDLGSSPTVTGRTAVPAGETKSPVNPVSVRVVMVRVSIVPISKGDLRVLAPSRPLFDRGPGVVALLGVVTVVSMEATISSFITAPDLCSDWVRGLDESLVSDLEKDLSSV
ncbi:hypothetical protein B296_00039620 [Ensete ventricosum]|uniref:Uncharacterized protein n=1 Tax=Ensete ventricosum TaxID=4639 RepID=A0A426X3Q4_ENSVE|nr:hypothetical protein B296_00039620 [Ensete ventricosum]